jgi:hypothetical protein
MQYKISENYIKEGLRIREEYFMLINQIVQQENIIKEYKKKVFDILESIEEKTQNDDIMMDVFNMEKNMKDVEEIIIPLYEKIDNVIKQSQLLYENIISIYPGVDIEDVKRQIMERF